MIRIDSEAWTAMLAHAEEAYPNECCGAMIGRVESGVKSVTRAVRLDNSFSGSQKARYEIRPEDLLEADRAARRDALDLIGIYHSHPDCDSYFSETDLKNSCPWYSFVVLSIRGGRFDHVTSWLPNLEQTAAESEPLTYPEKALWQES
ncbi:MAG TPA: M67 family metallopeptidase [Bryobacteraceae bacterium]